MPEGDRFPREERLRGLFDLFERLRERPSWRWRVRLRPVLLLLGPDETTDRLAEMFEKRCKDERAPVSHISADLTPEDPDPGDGADGGAGADVADVLREAKRELSQPTSRGRGEPALRFPLLEMALWLHDLRRIRLRSDDGPAPDATPSLRENHRLVRTVSQPPARHNENDRRRELNRVIRHRGRDVLRDVDEAPRGRTATFLTFLEQIAPIGVAVVALISAGTAAALDLAAAVLAAVLGLAFVTVQITARTRGWYGVRRYGWFLRQPYLRGDAPDFLSFALGVFDPRIQEDDGELAAHAEKVDLLLVAAFLEDLRRNYRLDYRRAAWARVRYPVVIFEHLTAGHPGVRFIELVERVRGGRDGEGVPGRLPGFDPLVVTAGVDPRAPADAEPSEPSEPSGPRLVERLDRAVRVDLGPGAPQNLVEARGLWDRYRRAQRRVGVLGGARLLRVDLTRDRRDRVLPPPRPARRRPRLAHPALPWVAMVLVAATSITVVSVQALRYCSRFDIKRTPDGQCVGVTDGAFRFGVSSGGENNDNRLNPVLGAIEEQNLQVMESGKPYATIVYLGPVTADPSIKNHRIDLLAGVQGELVGLSVAQRRFNDASQDLRLRVLIANAGAEFRHAVPVARQIRELARQDESIVAVVGFEQSRAQTVEAIQLLAKSALPLVGTASSYNGMGRLDRGGYSPYYFRLAPPNTRLARHAAYWARHGRAGGEPAENAVVVYNGDDDDLYSTDLAVQFRAEFGRDRVSMRPYDDPGDVDQTVREACENPPDLFYYAGRSAEFRGFVNVLELACPGRPLVMADDEIAKYVSDNAAEIGRKGTIELYFTPLAAREAWTPRWIGDQPPQTFYSDYDLVVGKLSGPGGARPSVTRAAVAYDAATLIANVAKRVYWEQQALPTSGSVFAALNDPERDVLPNGASGVLRFGPRSEGHPVVDKPVLLATVRPDGKIEVLQVCGKLIAKGQGKAQCPPEADR
ncbi:hypothetical protein GCM10010182_65350 [Actinomadura cremea]|nr:hypothetical protein GCM10010182_65350 [Actinomadura cremea]